MLCRLYQWQIEIRMDDGKPRGERLRKHIDQCPSCRQYAEQLQELAKTMSVPAPLRHQAQNLEPLKARIIDCLAAQRPVSLDVRQLGQIRRAKFCAAAMAACLLLAASVLMFDYSRPKPPDTRHLSSLSIAAKALQTPLPQWAEWSEKPIRSEMDKLMADTRQAAVFLWNCIPYPAEPHPQNQEQ